MTSARNIQDALGLQMPLHHWQLGFIEGCVYACADGTLTNVPPDPHYAYKTLRGATYSGFGDLSVYETEFWENVDEFHGRKVEPPPPPQAAKKVPKRGRKKRSVRKLPTT